MFSGIIEEAAKIEDINTSKIVIVSNLDHAKTKIGDSIALNGCCLTVTEINKQAEGTLLEFDISEETFRRTDLGNLKRGNVVNLERSMILGERICGHLVSGHVDSLLKLVSIKDEHNSKEMIWEFNKEYKKYIVEKGSITIAGTSLTVGEVKENTFAVYIIPHTFEVTTLSKLKVGDRANMEIDIIARYVLNCYE